MALGLTKNTLYGVDATYWRLAQSNIDWATKTLYLCLVGYISKEARDANSIPITQETIIFKDEEFPLLAVNGGDIRSILYNSVKVSKLDSAGNENNEWATATNI